MKWKIIPGPTAEYEISDEGEIRSNKRGYGIRIVKSRIAKVGYRMVALSFFGIHHKRYVHRLMAEAFIPNPEARKHVNHKNGIKSDNRLENLEWVTPKQNSAHAIETKLVKTGEHSPTSKITDAQVRAILLLRETSTLSQLEISKIFRISQGSVCRICNGYRTKFRFVRNMKEATKYSHVV